MRGPILVQYSVLLLYEGWYFLCGKSSSTLSIAFFTIRSEIDKLNSISAPKKGCSVFRSLPLPSGMQVETARSRQWNSTIRIDIDRFVGSDHPSPHQNDNQQILPTICTVRLFVKAPTADEPPQIQPWFDCEPTGKTTEQPLTRTTLKLVVAFCYPYLATINTQP